MLESRPNVEKIPHIKWRRPNLDDLKYESGEMKRVLETLFHISEENPKYETAFLDFYYALFNGKYTQLTEEDWERLENTDSYHGVQKGNLDDARKKAKEYGRQFANLIDAAKKSIELPAPTIIDYGGGLHKIAGNTRLMIARAQGEYPMVLIAKFNPDTEVEE